MCFIQNSFIVIMMRSHIKMVFWLCQVSSAMHRLSLVAGQKLSCSKAYGILIPPPGIKPTSLALEGGFYTTGAPRKSLTLRFLPVGNFPSWNYSMLQYHNRLIFQIIRRFNSSLSPYSADISTIPYILHTSHVQG